MEGCHGPSPGLPLGARFLSSQWGHHFLLWLCGDEHNRGAFSWCLINAQCPALRLDVRGGSPGALLCPRMRKRRSGVPPQVPVPGGGGGSGSGSSGLESDIWKEVGLGLT